jgi:hypothetical protein
MDTTSIGAASVTTSEHSFDRDALPGAGRMAMYTYSWPFDERQAEVLKEFDLGVQDDREAIQIII